MRSLFDTVALRRTTLANRIVMAPMGRGRSTAEGVPTPVMAEYYAQRAGAGLIIGEATNPSPIGVGHAFSVQLHTDAQQAGWSEVTEAVHRAGGRIYLQIMHAGRISHPQLHGRTPIAPSAVRPAGAARTFEGPLDYPVPQAADASELARTVADFVACARRGMQAGFDGVELHGANGYLLHQFLSPVVNRRTDRYGGAVANRIRFPVEVAEAVAAEVGADRMGMRLSPGFLLNDMAEPDAAEVYPVLLRELAGLGLSHVHFVAGSTPELVRALRGHWPGQAIINLGTGELDARATVDAAERALADGFDLLSFGRQFLANPDLPHRLDRLAPLNTPDRATFYEGGSRGCTDYPALDVPRRAVPTP
ncbi:alkene reductase [Kitasatospora sp. MAA4]|uniref:alkene reductase n=1 Tax=Kitasatospora sp. MAA4 TaxID=3035093 RepID=UPI002476C2F6|nr:alkene reductase [Kitasatospora sp. MAA4]